MQCEEKADPEGTSIRWIVIVICVAGGPAIVLRDVVNCMRIGRRGNGIE